MDFIDLDLADAVLDGLEAMNFFTATPIQEACIPPLLEGRDLLGCAQTGSGKTAAYLLPIINRIAQGQLPAGQVKAVIMAPTRELAKQIDQQVEGFAYYVPGLSTMAVYGGTDGVAWAQQQRALDTGADIIVATPGRLQDLMNFSAVSLSGVCYFVLDEADRMLDMGFYEDILSIFKSIPKTTQVVMFSATMPAKIKTLARNILKDPVFKEIAVARPPESIRQTAYLCSREQRLPLLLHLLKSAFSTAEEAKQRILIFSRYKKEVKEIHKQLLRCRIQAASIHSDKTQEEREAVLRDFRSARVPVLVATDVVSRGIDIDGIGVVINFEVPGDNEDYVHRIGRTARGTHGSGLAITFITPKEYRFYTELQQFLNNRIELLEITPEMNVGEQIAVPAKGAEGRSNRRPPRGRRPGRSSSSAGSASRGKRPDRKAPSGGEAEQSASPERKPRHRSDSAHKGNTPPNGTPQKRSRRGRRNGSRHSADTPSHGADN